MNKLWEKKTSYINFGLVELRKRFLFLVFSLLIFRLGSFIPIPGINTVELSRLIYHHQGTFIEMLNMFSGGSLSRASIFSLGIMPYISASIIVQLLSLIYPKLKDLKKEGEIGKRKINQFIRYVTLVLAIFQSIGIVSTFSNISNLNRLVVVSSSSFYFFSILSLVSGTMFLMWLGELITERGIGNGVSIIIFSGILVGFPSAIGTTLEKFRIGDLSFFLIFCILCFIFFITFLVVFIEKSQRRILVQYARRQQGRRMYSAHTNHLPLKVNMSGVMPAIFSSSIMLFPATIASWFGGFNKLNWLFSLFFYFRLSNFLYLLIYALTIIFFCFFYIELMFNSNETAENLKKSGAFVPGIRPGKQTAKFIRKIIVRLTVIGSIYISLICLIPEILRNYVKVPFYFGGTSLLIVVIVIIDFISQVQTIMMSSQYNSVLKKSNLNFKN
ncbi:Preprotein translocase subunit SecY [Buchnera aphidicola (Tetraneura ulmi)]|uniref:preprotein translocase subunit SecY n=1 Tax=Buchnera aphidicola TaxID=9 RepID=UPI003463D4DE